MLGAGTSPAGLAPAGIGMPVTVAGYAYTQGSAGAVSSVSIDPRSRDTVIASDGTEEGMSDAAQRVLLCCMTARQTIAVKLGFGMARPTKIAATFTAEITQAIMTALAPVIADGAVRVTEVTVATLGSRASAIVRWVDLRRSAQQVQSTQTTF